MCCISLHSGKGLPYSSSPTSKRELHFVSVDLFVCLLVKSSFSCLLELLRWTLHLMCALVDRWLDCLCKTQKKKQNHHVNIIQEKDKNWNETTHVKAELLLTVLNKWVHYHFIHLHISHSIKGSFIVYCNAAALPMYQ